MLDPFADFFGEAKATLPKADAFKLLDTAIPKRSTLPCLQRVKITGEPGYLTFEGTDLDFAVSVRTGNFLDLEGSTTVDWKEFKAKHDTFPVSDMENHPVEDYPALPEPDGELVGTEWLEDGLKVLYAVSTLAERGSLQGIYVHADGVVATDGHRLHLVKGSHTLDAIIPPKVFKAAKSLGTPTEARATERTLHLVYPWGHAASKVIEGPYPNYRRIIPSTEGRMEALIHLATLKDAASKSCEIEKNNPKIDIRNGTISISNGTGGLHSFADVLLPPGFEIQFNAKYLLETLATLRGLVTVSVKAPLAAVLFNPKDAREVRILMPLNPGK
jgi:DNA polymerase III sliding clamp (beta) subunit (PCNA family)